jgi:hypothetical protein
MTYTEAERAQIAEVRERSSVAAGDTNSAQAEQHEAEIARAYRQANGLPEPLTAGSAAPLAPRGLSSRGRHHHHRHHCGRRCHGQTRRRHGRNLRRGNG